MSRPRKIAEALIDLGSGIIMLFPAIATLAGAAALWAIGAALRAPGRAWRRLTRPRRLPEALERAAGGRPPQPFAYRRCNACGDERRDEFLQGADIPIEVGPMAGSGIMRRFRFCWDRMACIERARDVQRASTIE